MAVAKTLPCTHQSGWVDVYSWTGHWGVEEDLSWSPLSLELREALGGHCRKLLVCLGGSSKAVVLQEPLQDCPQPQSVCAWLHPPAVMHGLLQPCWQVWPPRKDFPQPVLASQLSEMSVEAAVGEVGPCDNSHPCSICRFTSPVPATP
ncbi:hypothetical protein J1605_020602 [Eschrichtius robustus]|uniref:Uncharacterized protein n=1 Tax=Eschrichtius robustus TaxID=9764 RepID=A0AB34HIE8_ESCRO|nr:hypothetical protein J1605_020602 [Eschrichtius robustus]